MESSGNLEGPPVVTSKGGPPAAASSVCGTDTLLPLEKHSAQVGTTSREAEHSNSSLEAQICMEFEKSVGLGMKKGLQKSSTFPTSAAEEAEQGVDLSSSSTTDEDMKDVPAYERSLSLPPTLKPISAMKGSRQKNGMASPTENRRVKWAPEVYDPPVMSVCHSVNSSYHYQRRSKPRRKEKSKQKKKQKSKSKKSHHNSAQNSSAMQTPDLGLEKSDAQSSLKDLGKHEAVILDYSIGKEAKCGSSFLRESVAKMHFSIGEAS